VTLALSHCDVLPPFVLHLPPSTLFTLLSISLPLHSFHAISQVASHDKAAREELVECQRMLHSLQGLQMEERSLRAGEIQFARRA